MNPLAKTTSFGTAAELLVQLRLLQFGVQASAPLKDSGNDLIAIFGETFRSIQVKATEKGDRIQVQQSDLETEGGPKRFHILALVFTGPLPTDGSLWDLGAFGIYLLPRPAKPLTYRRADLAGTELREALVRHFWPG